MASSGTFPILPDSARQAAGWLADPNAGPCPAASIPDTTTWQRVRSQFRSAYVDPISFLLPSGYDTLKGIPDRPDDFMSEAGPRWEHTMGSWWLIRGPELGHHPTVESFGFWVGSDSGYPNQGVSPAPKPVALLECQLTIAGAPAHVVSYSLADSERVTYTVAAYWKVREGVRLRASGDEVDRPGAPDFLYVLRSMGYDTR